jgi:uncharacterized protein YukE
MAWVGMNDTEVKAQGSVLQVEAEKIKALVAKVDTEITAISQNWHGDEWNTHKNELNQAQTLLQNMKTTIDQQVTEQVNTSSAY